MFTHSSTQFAIIHISDNNGFKNVTEKNLNLSKHSGINKNISENITKIFDLGK